MAVVITVAVVFLCGWIIGLSYNGINITINHKAEEKEVGPVDYNESLVDELDPEIRNYYDNTRGLNKF